MSIHVQCSCGKSYRVQDALAGRKCKCRSCGGVLEIPTGGLQIQEAPGGADVGTPSLEGLSLCPSCGNPLKPQVFLCVHCGYDTTPRARKQSTTRRTKDRFYARWFRKGFTWVPVCRVASLFLNVWAVEAVYFSQELSMSTAKAVGMGFLAAPCVILLLGGYIAVVWQLCQSQSGLLKLIGSGIAFVTFPFFLGSAAALFVGMLPGWAVGWVADRVIRAWGHNGTTS